MRRPTIKTPCVADRYADRSRERIAEIGFYGAGVNAGALVSARVTGDGRALINVYAVDPKIDVRAADTPEARAIDAIALVLGDPTSGAAAKLSAILAAVVHTGRQVTPAGPDVAAAVLDAHRSIHETAHNSCADAIEELTHTIETIADGLGITLPDAASYDDETDDESDDDAPEVTQTACRHCGQDIEGIEPYPAGEWRDRGNNTHCPTPAGDAGQVHEPF